MSGWQWGQLCGRGVDNLTVWHNNDFGHCFEQLVFVCGSHAILAVLSAFYISHGVYRLQGLQLSQPWPINIRFGVSLLFVLCVVVQMTLTWAWLRVHLSMMDIIAGCVVGFAWLLHAAFLWRLRRMNHLPIQGPLVVVLAYLLTVASIVIQARTVTLHMLNHSEYLNRAEAYTTYAMAGLHLCYLFSLLPFRRPGYREGSLSTQSLSYERIETDPLLYSEHRNRVYGVPGELATDDGLGVGEDANCFSKLFFHWVQPLMSRGYQGKISAPDDLFELPPRLRTDRIESIFSKAMNAHSILDESLELSHRGADPRLASLQELPDVAIVTSQNTMLPTRENSSSSMRSGKPTLTLMRALHTVFGCEYYSVGILKLLSDMLGFAGPILLNLLVSFIENKVEKVWHGYLYAGGLCGSTFLASMLSSHFNYLVQMVALKIRAAVISTIYRKSLVVNSVSLSRFSTGEVVNFMSTDTDRIVNFCPSFHQFWSLPFQIAVSLYLLHQQVGLAFLAGLGFAILLIPINRWLAIKIGQLSTAMMSQKDGRVKLMNEMLCGIRVVKFYTWEEHFTCRINELRQAELRSLKGRKYLDAMCVYFWATTPVLISILTFATYALLGHKLTAAKVRKLEENISSKS